VHATVDGAVVIVEETPFHPVDHTWPDQPGDAGTIRAGGDTVGVTEAVMAAVSDDGAFAVGADIPVKRGVEGWTWLVGHLVDDAPGWLTEGAQVALEVDAARRDGLSRGHTACHLASLALDLTVADLWRKDPGVDALGNPDFEGRANQSSRIADDGAVDEYRLGKSLRRAGFDTEGFTATLAEREARINEQLSAWISSGASSMVETDGSTIVDRRRWRCALPEGDAVIPCGGTHVRSLAEFASITVTLELSDPQTLVMTTTVVPATGE
jgi:alanyl-tRNA synthetase